MNKLLTTSFYNSNDEYRTSADRLSCTGAVEERMAVWDNKSGCKHCKAVDRDYAD